MVSAGDPIADAANSETLRKAYAEALAQTRLGETETIRALRRRFRARMVSLQSNASGLSRTLTGQATRTDEPTHGELDRRKNPRVGRHWRRWRSCYFFLGLWLFLQLLKSVLRLVL